MTILHHGKRERWGSIPAKASLWEQAEDGSAVIGDGRTFMAIDFSGAGGADGMLVMTGPGSPAGTVVEAGGHTFSFKFLTRGEPPTPKAKGDSVVIGKQTVSMRNGRLVLGVFSR